MTSNQKKICDRLWQIKVTASGICSICGKHGTEGHHILKRRYLSVRWLPDNGRCLCRECHVWAENNPQAYEDLIVEEIGVEAYQALREKARMVVKQFYDEIREELKC